MAVYKYLKSLGDNIFADPDIMESDIFGEFGISLNREEILTCLDFFSRMGIAAFTEESGGFRITILK